MSVTRHYLTDLDLDPHELRQVLTLARHLKAEPYSLPVLQGPQTAVVIFDKTSTRTRVSFAAGIAALGGNPLIINPGESQLGHKESIADTARIMSSQTSLLIWRTHAHSGLQEMAAHSSVPVINALCQDYHPCQILADLLTIEELRGSLTKQKLVYLGDAANNMAQSYVLGGVNAGMDVTIAGPKGHLPSAEVISAAEQRAALTGSQVTVTSDAEAAVVGADVLATDTWVSMGDESETAQRAELFTEYQINAHAVARAKSDAIVLHCLPAYRGAEITAEVLDGPQSAVWQEAENRLHAQKALMAWLLVESGQADARSTQAVKRICGQEG